MSGQITQPGPGGTDQNAAGGGSGSAENQNSKLNNDQSGSGGQGENQKHVPYETFQRLLDEKKSLKSRFDEVNTKLSERLEADKAREEDELKKNGDLEKLVQLRDDEITKLREEVSTLKGGLSERDTRDQNARKLHSFLGALNGKIDQKYWDHIPIQDIAIDPATGRVDEMSVAKAVETFRQEHPALIQGLGGPRLPNSAPGGASGKTISYAEWEKLPASEMKKWEISQIRD